MKKKNDLVEKNHSNKIKNEKNHSTKVQNKKNHSNKVKNKKNHRTSHDHNIMFTVETVPMILFMIKKLFL